MEPRPSVWCMRTHTLGLIHLLVWCLLFTVKERQVAGQPALTSNTCETYVGGIKQYYACQGEPLRILWNALFSVTVSPIDYTCGRVPESYCTLGYRNCSTCDSNNPDLYHPVQYMYDIRPDTGGPRLDTWWQSRTWNNLYPIPLEINITFSFGKEYELQNDLEITFRNSRPQSFILWKSLDNGTTWTPWQYYEKSCKDRYLQGVPRVLTPAQPTAVICTEDYSSDTPYLNGVLSFPVLTQRLKLFLGNQLSDIHSLYMGFNRTSLNKFLTFTDIRFQLRYPQTDGLEVFKKPEDLINYYYAISDIKIEGGCSCNLHAKYCSVVEGHTACVCQHNTAGDNCERCLPLYNNRPWLPGFYLPYPTGTANECQACECNAHAASCEYNDIIRSGVCINCTHNTTGINCQQCAPGFFKNTTALNSSPNTCLPCNCNLLGVQNNDTTCAAPYGTCNCKNQVEGDKCDRCEYGLFGLLDMANAPGTCKSCNCVRDGTVDSSNACNQTTGQCYCKDHIIGTNCSQCQIGYYNFPTGRPWDSCHPCGCDPGGSLSPLCNPVNSSCSCRPGLTGNQCDTPSPGYFSPGLDDQQFQPTGGQCTLDTAVYSPQNPTSGRAFATCMESQNVEFENIIPKTQTNVIQQFLPVIRYSLNSTAPWPAATLVVTVTGNSGVDIMPYQLRLIEPLAPGCSQVAGQSQAFTATNLTQGFGKAWVSPSPLLLDARCSYSHSLTTSLRGPAQEPIIIDSIVMMPDYRSMGLYLEAASCPSFTQIGDAGSKLASNCDHLGGGGGYDLLSCMRTTCAQGGNTFNFHQQEKNCYFKRCIGRDFALIRHPAGYQVYTNLNVNPSTRATYDACAAQIAQLSTKVNAMNNLECQKLSYSTGAGAYNGGSLCNCDTTGTVAGTRCQIYGGQCDCKPGVTGRRCHQCAPGFYNFGPSGCLPCNCNTLGSATGVCDYLTGQCNCKINVAIAGADNTLSFLADLRCSACLVNHYGFNSGQGCQPCSCDFAGSLAFQCDDEGNCPCKPTIGSPKCNQCQAGYYSFSSAGCLQCNCSTAGSVDIRCHPITGSCNCKENVNPPKCETCKLGSFNLQASNPEGCQMCFCFGHSALCSPATGYAARYITTDSTAMWVTATIRTPYGLGDYISAPANYLGNHYYAYGNILNVKMQGQFGFFIQLMDQQFVVLQGNDQMVYYNGSNFILDGSLQSFDLILHQNYWHYNATMKPNYFEFYAILADLQGIHVKVMYGLIDATVTSVTLTTAGIAAGTEPQVSYVENCTCDTSNRNVIGQSCERCSTGFQRLNVNGTKYESCRQCICTGRGETTPPQCDELTGQCLNCRIGTTGFYCESCGPNVIDSPNCDQCADTYWGIGYDGCRSCDCHPIGSIPPSLCDKTTGQCSCRAFVQGRTCGECIDNYQQMSTAGCIPCDACYQLVGDQMNILRAMRDNLTIFVNNLIGNDSNMIMGPFTVRLQNAVARMASLVNFLADATLVGATVGQQVETLNMSLRAVQETLDIDVPGSIFIINNSALRADDYLLTGQLVFGDTNRTALEAYRLLADMETVSSPVGQTISQVTGRPAFTPGPLIGASARVNQLVTSLQGVELSMRQISGGAMADVTRLSQIVEKIEADTQQAEQQAENVLGMTQDAQARHLNTSIWIRNLEFFEAQVAATGRQVLTLANNTYLRAQEMLNRISEINNNASNIQVIAVNISILENNAQQFKVVAEQIAASANAANEAAMLDIVAKSNSANIKTAELLEKLTNAKGISDNIMTRILQAHAIATNGTATGSQVFDDAETMLQVMRNFRSMAQRVQREANQSILEVQIVAGTTDQAITEAVRLQQDLVVSHNAAQGARDSASLAKQEADGQVSFLFDTYEKAILLDAEASGLLNDVHVKSANISNINATVVDPAKSVCLSLEADLRSLAFTTQSAENAAQNITNQVTTTQSQIAAMDRDLTSVQYLNVTEIALLQGRVNAALVDLNSRNFQQTINELQSLSSEQRAWIDVMSARKEELRKKIRRLRNVQEQLRTRVGA